MSSGCASCPTVVYDVLGTSHADLEKARDVGITREFDMSLDQTFNRVLEILKEDDLIVFQKSERRDYIVAIGFPKQNNTTRVGIFFEGTGNNQTSITLSSLSSTALQKADTMILEKI